MPAKKLYALGRVKHNGVVFEPGAEFNPERITASQRARLLEIKAIGEKLDDVVEVTPEAPKQ